MDLSCFHSGMSKIKKRSEGVKRKSCIADYTRATGLLEGARGYVGICELSSPLRMNERAEWNIHTSPPTDAFPQHRLNVFPKSTKLIVGVVENDDRKFEGHFSRFSGYGLGAQICSKLIESSQWLVSSSCSFIKARLEGIRISCNRKTGVAAGVVTKIKIRHRYIFYNNYIYSIFFYDFYYDKMHDTHIFAFT